MNLNPRIGLVLLFEGDYRRVCVPISGVDAFTAVSAVMKQGDADVTSLYSSSTPLTFAGNMLFSGKIGVGSANAPAGTYRYFISGTYAGKVRTWYWDVLVLPKELTYLSEIPLDDYDPFIDEIVCYEGDKFIKQFSLPDLALGGVSGVLKLLNEDVTATYCSTAGGALPSVSGGTFTTHNIGSVANMPPGDYGYFLTGVEYVIETNSAMKTTWYYKIKVLPKASPI